MTANIWSQLGFVRQQATSTVSVISWFMIQCMINREAFVPSLFTLESEEENSCCKAMQW